MARIGSSDVAIGCWHTKTQAPAETGTAIGWSPQRSNFRYLVR